MKRTFLYASVASSPSLSMLLEVAISKQSVVFFIFYF